MAAESAQPGQTEEQDLGNPLDQETTEEAPPRTPEPNKAVNVSFLYSGEVWSNVGGGIKQGQSTINNFDASAAIDGEKSFSWEGASFLLDTFYASSGDLRNLTGAIQQASAYETDTGPFFRVYQAWYDQKFNNDKTSVLVGLYDTNTEFDHFESSDLFFNSGFGLDTTFDQSGINGPSTYPDTSLALRLKHQLADSVLVQAAVLDGVPDAPRQPRTTSIEFGSNRGALLLGEADYTPAETTKLMAGYWRYTAGFAPVGADQAASRQTGNEGGYLGLGQTLYQKDDRHKLDSFARLGFANTEFNEFGRSFDAGFVYRGLLPGRDDQLGVAYNIAENGEPYKQQARTAGIAARDYEGNLELTYRTPINGWLTVQPDAQYTINPGTDPALKNDLIIGIRFEIGYQLGFDSLVRGR
jgi:porin